MLKNLFLLAMLAILRPYLATAQSCTPLGDQVSYGSNNIWIGYVYDVQNFTNYMGFVNEGSPASPNFNTDFGGPYFTLATTGCPVYGEDFSIRYKLTKNFTPGTYTFTISGDDRVRLSIDGGATWLINLWTYNGYLPGKATVNLSGNYNLVFEYAEGAHQNNVFFNVEQSCTAALATQTFGTTGIWNAYLFSGVNFDQYKGSGTEVTGANLSFNQNFGGSAVEYPTTDCPVFTDFFSVRYKMRANLPYNSYTLTVSGDDKYRLSIDGGNTWVIDRWGFNTGTTTRMYTANLNGVYDMILEYYEKDGTNNIQFATNRNIVLPMGLESFTGQRLDNGILLKWQAINDGTLREFEIERSLDGATFQAVGKLISNLNGGRNYSFKDLFTSPAHTYYRLKITNSLSETIYSRVISIAGAGSGTKIYPTLVNNNMLYLSNDYLLNNASIQINDIAGRLVAERSLGNLSARQTTSLYLDNFHLQKGIYVVFLLNSGQLVKSERILLQ